MIDSKRLPAVSPARRRAILQALPPEQRTILMREFMRRDFITFLAQCLCFLNPGEVFELNWHHSAIAEALQQIECGEVRRQVINLPPRYLKSQMISVAWVAFILGRYPQHRFMCVGYSDELAAKLMRDCARIMRSPWFKTLFPKCKLVRDTASTLVTSQGGGRYSVPVGGQITGFGAHTIIIDDPMKPTEAKSEVARAALLDWYREVLVSRLDDKKSGSIVLVMQRLHQADLTGQLLEAGGWALLKLPAIAPEDLVIPIEGGRTHLFGFGEALHPAREPLDVLHDTRASMGEETFQAQYGQDPQPASGALLKAHWLGVSPKGLKREPGDTVIQSWDGASKGGLKNDYSVCVSALVRRGEVHILHVFRERLDFPDLLAAVKVMAAEHRPDTLLIEDANSGTQLIQTLERDRPRCVPQPTAVKVKDSKLMRMEGVSHLIANGKLFLPEYAPWLAAFKKELIAFPGGLHDDQVDALSHLLARVRDRLVLPRGLLAGGVLKGEAVVLDGEPRYV